MSISAFDLFKVGIGRSSSHTVGPMVAARQFVLGLQAQGQLTACAELYGFLGAAGAGYASPKAVILGLAPVLLGPQIYVTAALLGVSSYTPLQGFEATAPFALPVSIAAAFLLRAGAILFDLRLPKYGGADDPED